MAVNNLILKQDSNFILKYKQFEGRLKIITPFFHLLPLSLKNNSMKVSKFIERSTLLIIFSVGLFGLSSCLDEIDFASSGTIDEAIAIQGKVVKANPSYIGND